jgi:hypothetical protein
MPVSWMCLSLYGQQCCPSFCRRLVSNSFYGQLLYIRPNGRLSLVVQHGGDMDWLSGRTLAANGRVTAMVDSHEM